MQFLVEALSLSLIGGIAGMRARRARLRLDRALLGWPLHLNLDGIVVSVAVSGAVGLVFGVYPAMRAAALDPIEALRFES